MYKRQGLSSLFVLWLGVGETAKISMVAMGAVSYTHLDVYKRQGLAIGDAVVRATGGEWRVGDAALGGARMEVRWHRSSGPRTSGPRASPLDARTAPGAEREARLRT